MIGHRERLFPRIGARPTRFALTNVDLNIEPGQFVAIIGQNGSGKSTLVKLLTTVLYPTEGNIRIDGVPVNKAPVGCAKWSVPSSRTPTTS